MFLGRDMCQRNYKNYVYHPQLDSQDNYKLLYEEILLLFIYIEKYIKKEMLTL